MRTLLKVIALSAGLALVLLGYFWAFYGDGGDQALASMLLGIFLWVEWATLDP